ncbi:MAG: Kelch repeat-containing protein [Solirubrobacteraceae bacterium]
MPSASRASGTARACLLALSAGLAVAGCGGSSRHGSASTSRPPRPARSGQPPARAGHRSTRHRRLTADLRLDYRSLYSLPAAIRDPATAVLGAGRFALLGGLDAADVSSAAIEVADAHRAASAGSLPGPQHDAQAAAIGGDVYVFGGGYTTELDHILRWDPATRTVAEVGALSVPQSDVAVAAWSGTAYIVGGYDGTDYLNTIVAWQPGGRPTVQARLPVGLRYAAAAVSGGGLLVIGGSTPAGASDAIYRFDLSTHRVRRIGTLPHPTTHGGAAALRSTVYFVGGRGDALDAQTDAIYAIDPLTGAVRRAGRLPVPTSDAAVVALDDGIVVAGGQSPSGVRSTVGELVAAAG